MDRDELVGWLNRLPAALPMAQIGMLFQLARNQLEEIAADPPVLIDLDYPQLRERAGACLEALALGVG